MGKEEKRAMEYMRRKSRRRHYCGAGPTVKIQGCGGNNKRKKKDFLSVYRHAIVTFYIKLTFFSISCV